MKTNFDVQVEQQIARLKKAGKHKQYRAIEGSINAHALLRSDGDVIMLASNNYLGLADHPRVIANATRVMQKFGAGTASVRFICGTMTIHERLEDKLANFHKTEAAITFSSCWVANTGLLPTITNAGDVVFSDALNHASIIDACKLCDKYVVREIYEHSNMVDLEKRLKQHENIEGNKFIITDGVFSMEGDLCDLPKICELARKYNATVIVDDSHGVGVVGKTGRGVAEFFGLESEVDIFTGTLGKALGGAAGGYIAGREQVIDLIKQNARSHIFSNGISPATVGAALQALDMIMMSGEGLVVDLKRNIHQMRDGLEEIGFNPLKSESAIISLEVGKTETAIEMSQALLEEGIFVIGFGYPVVPEGKARLRIQVSAAHKRTDIEAALKALKKVGESFNLV